MFQLPFSQNYFLRNYRSLNLFLRGRNNLPKHSIHLLCHPQKCLLLRCLSIVCRRKLVCNAPHAILTYGWRHLPSSVFWGQCPYTQVYDIINVCVVLLCPLGPRLGSQDERNLTGHEFTIVSGYWHTASYNQMPGTIDLSNVCLKMIMITRSIQILQTPPRLWPLILTCDLCLASRLRKLMSLDVAYCFVPLNHVWCLLV